MNETEMKLRNTMTTAGTEVNKINIKLQEMESSNMRNLPYRHLCIQSKNETEEDHYNKRWTKGK